MVVVHTSVLTRPSIEARTYALRSMEAPAYAGLNSSTLMLPLFLAGACSELDVPDSSLER